MNANRNMTIDFRVNHKHDHFIKPNKHPNQVPNRKKSFFTKQRKGGR